MFGTVSILLQLWEMKSKEVLTVSDRGRLFSEWVSLDAKIAGDVLSCANL